MVLALVIFITTYILMLAFQKYRPVVALSSAALFVVLGLFGIFDLSPLDALSEVDYNVLLMIGGTMGIVTLFIESKMPARLAELIITKVPNVCLAVAALSLFAGIISAFVDNVATVLMVAPVGLAISKKLNISPVPVLIAISVSSNLQGAATLVGDTTSILLGGYAEMNFMDFFFMQGKPGIFWGVEIGAITSILVLLFIFRKQKQPISAKVETTVSDYFPSFLMIAVVVCLIFASFIKEPTDALALKLYELRSGLICVALCIVGVVYTVIKTKSLNICKKIFEDLDKDTLLLLFGLFIIIAGIKTAGVIDAVADLFYHISGDNPFLLYTLLVFASVVLSAFIDNIPYVATMLPVVSSIASLMNGGSGIDPTVFYFGLLSGATLGGNLTPIGASANIVTIGILRKNGENVKTSDFLKIGVPFTLVAVLSGYIFLWLVWHP